MESNLAPGPYLALLQCDGTLTPDEMTRLRDAMDTIENASVMSIETHDALGATAREIVLGVSLGIAANFATESIEKAIDLAGIGEKVRLEEVIPHPNPTRTKPANMPRVAVSRSSDDADG